MRKSELSDCIDIQMVGVYLFTIMRAKNLMEPGY